MHRSAPRSIAINAASAVSVFVQEKKLTMVSLPHGHRLGTVRVATPDVDDELAVDIDGYRGAELFTFGYLVGQRLGDLVEAGIPVTMHDVAQPGHHHPIPSALFGPQTD